ncbi:unnamed protein product, partial [Chrysoparadoxa australica]
FYGYAPGGDDELELPARSIDVRIFVTRPHLAVIEYPRSRNSSAVVIEAEEGIFYRYQWLATPQLLHMEAFFRGLAFVVQTNYTNAESMRGMRGTSGSGRYRCNTKY